ncbi:MAG TPA: GNAT family N-acetyltransferase [Azospirillaceae bacterium]|nr:GNAT family N-acetyltransferase [Azospirillaceae bacterium]
MQDRDGAATIKLVPNIDKVAADDWDACAGADNPFVSHAFLKALEETGCVGGRTGWTPTHMVAEGPDGRVIGVVPLYLKQHSFGEYVFDHGWANAYESAGGTYYPKLQSAVPFTPVPGPRLLVRPGAPEETADMLAAGIEAAARQMGVSSAHVTFPTEADWTRLGEAGWLQRTGQQFHWYNDGYADFDAFLDALNARKRKAIRRERRSVAESGVELSILTGPALKAEHWDAFYRFYVDTGGRKWGSPYLNRAFFHRLGEVMGDKVALIMGRLDGRWVCGALNLIGTDTLYGRNWGAVVHVPFLHFEACYYLAIEFAISRGLAKVEAGAQGEHKIQRGYVPTRTYSAHWIRDPGFRRAVANYLERERAAVDAEMEALAEYAPFRQGVPTEERE